MRNLYTVKAERISGSRLPPHFRGYAGDNTCGAFTVRSPVDKAELMIMASSDYGWEHVSVSRRNRCPNWTEMSFVKDLFFNEDETVVQFHVPSSDHVNDHPNCLHLWRPTHQKIPRPHGWMVGGMSPDQAEKEMENLDQDTGLPK